jgi:hypothetical protein
MVSLEYNIVMKYSRVCKQCGKTDYVFKCQKDRPFCSMECKNISQSASNRGDKHPGWKGGRVYSHGYIVSSGMHTHPMADSRGQVREHRLIMAEYLGRNIEPWEDVHHINGIRDDNRIENLEVLNHRDHISKDNAQKGKKYWGINAHLDKP